VRFLFISDQPPELVGEALGRDIQLSERLVRRQRNPLSFWRRLTAPPPHANKLVEIRAAYDTILTLSAPYLELLTAHLSRWWIEHPIPLHVHLPRPYDLTLYHGNLNWETPLPCPNLRRLHVVGCLHTAVALGLPSMPKLEYIRLSGWEALGMAYHILGIDPKRPPWQAASSPRGSELSSQPPAVSGAMPAEFAVLADNVHRACCDAKSRRSEHDGSQAARHRRGRCCQRHTRAIPRMLGRQWSSSPDYPGLERRCGRTWTRRMERELVVVYLRAAYKGTHICCENACAWIRVLISESAIGHLCPFSVVVCTSKATRSAGCKEQVLLCQVQMSTFSWRTSKTPGRFACPNRSQSLSPSATS
jgi:hypothetical protein